MSFRTRFAPSPTGPLHLGHAYSAMLAHDMALAEGGVTGFVIGLDLGVVVFGTAAACRVIVAGSTDMAAPTNPLGRGTTTDASNSPSSSGRPGHWSESPSESSGSSTLSGSSSTSRGDRSLLRLRDRLPTEGGSSIECDINGQAVRRR